MDRVKTATLKNNLSRYLARVRKGDEVVVLDRDTPVARLVPFVSAEGPRTRSVPAERADEERLAEMERMGVIRRGLASSVHGWLDTHEPARLPQGSASLLGTLLDLRREDER